MLPEQLPNADTTQEHEQKPKVLFTAHGYIHEPLNLQGVPEILDAFGKHLEMHEGKKVLYLEAVGLSPEKARLLQRGIDKRGFKLFTIETMLAEKLGRLPKNNEIKDISYRIEHRVNNDVKRILDLGLLPIDDIQQYFLFSGLDKLRAIHNFDIVHEVHGQSVITDDDILDRQNSEFSIKAPESWDKGNFDNALKEIKNAYSSVMQSGILREKDMAAQLQEITESLSQQAKGGSLFVLVGDAHLPIVEAIRRNLGDQVSVRYQRNIGINENVQFGRIASGIRSGELASDETYMQALIVELVLNHVLNQSIIQGTISTVAANYQSLFHKMQTVASGISLEKGRELCEKQVPLYDFLLKQ
jgi:hypothetical protein